MLELALASANGPFRCIALNAASLVLGVVGNIFLLFNFTRRIRYIIALPMTILLWYIATGIVSVRAWQSFIQTDELTSCLLADNYPSLHALLCSSNSASTNVFSGLLARSRRSHFVSCRFDATDDQHAGLLSRSLPAAL